MSRATLILANDMLRAKAKHWIDLAPDGAEVTFKRSRRTLAQNALLWSLLTELSEQLLWHGAKLSAEDYKDLLTASFRREVRTIPNTDGDGFVILGMRTSRMTKEEMSDLIELIYAFGARHGVRFASAPDPLPEQARAA